MIADYGDGSVALKEVREYDGSEAAPDFGGSSPGMDNAVAFAPTQPLPILRDAPVGGITVNAPKLPETATAAPVVPPPVLRLESPTPATPAAAAADEPARVTRTVIDTRLVYVGLVIVAIGIAIAIANSNGSSST